MEIRVGDKVLSGPILIPSISRFETQGEASDLVRLQHALNEPISLVSAHDVAADAPLLKAVSQFAVDKRVVFLDSGGYEASRINRYVPGYIDGWTFERFKDSAEKCPHDLVASFDRFWDGADSVDAYSFDLIDALQDYDFVETGKLVPVVHLTTFRNDKFLGDDQAVDLVDRIAVELSPAFIAIPERELGAGLRRKVQLARRIVDRLNEKGRTTQLHILGCGNPLTFALLAGAGIAMSDGLEWCRTLVGPQFHLHHFQQAEEFGEAENSVYNPMAEVIREEGDGYLVRTLARNLHALQGYQRSVAQALEGGTLREFIEANFGPTAAAAL